MSEVLIYRMKDLPAAIGLSRAEIYRRLKSGDFPKPVALGPKAVGWTAESVRAWLRTLVPQPVPQEENSRFERRQTQI